MASQFHNPTIRKANFCGSHGKSKLTPSTFAVCPIKMRQICSLHIYKTEHQLQHFHTQKKQLSYHPFRFLQMGSDQTRFIALALVLLIAASTNYGGLRFSNAQTICNVSVAGLMACKSAVTPPHPAPPSGDCCSALSHADMRCLCSYRNSQLLPSLGIDPNLAMQLPAKCKLPHPAHC